MGSRCTMISKKSYKTAEAVWKVIMEMLPAEFHPEG